MDRPVNADPMTPMQQGMLYDSLSAPGSGFYLQQLVVTFEAPLDRDALKRAWDEVAGRHEILRASCRWTGECAPRLQFEEGIETALEDADGAPDAAFLEKDRRRGFDPSKAPLWRVTLFPLHAPATLVWTFHHLLLDGRSHTLILDELLEAYAAIRAGRAPQFVSAASFRPYLQWLAGEPEAAAAEFWCDRLPEEVVPASLLPPGLPEPPGDEGWYVHRERVLSEETGAEVHRAAAWFGVTTNTLFQAVWALLLRWYSEEDALVFGVTRACRHWRGEQADTAAGLFANTTPFPVRIDPVAPLGPWLAALRAQQVEMRAREHDGLTRIREWTGRTSTVPLFKALLVVEGYDLTERFRTRWNAEVELHEKPNLLTLGVYDGSCIRLSLDAPAEIYPEAQVDRFLEQIETGLRSLARSDPSRLLDEIEFVSPDERSLQIDQWSGIEAPYPDDCAVHRLIEAQARKTPDAVAVETPDEQISYRELDARANRLARVLLRLGIRKGARVGVCLDARAELDLAMLAIFKAGAVYVPLDPGNPADRLTFYLEDSGAELVLTCAELRATVPDVGCPVLEIGLEGPEGEDESVEPPEVAAGPDDDAYILYTSGSTGTPKGVITEHGGLCNCAEAEIRLYGLGPGDRVLQFSTPSFDVSIYEVMMALTVGATLRTGTAADLVPGPALTKFLKRQRISAVTLTPTVLRAMPFDPLPDLRVLVCCGEACPSDLLDAWAGGRRFFNAYGPTEVTIWSTSDECVPGEKRPSIGRPIPNLRVYVLDAHRRPVPAGAPGELYIGGAGVGRGYLNRPERTAEHFLPDPFDGREGARMYRTGDKVRYLPDGRIDFIRRMDRQVKIRGVRVELGEIESVIRRHPGVDDAVVLLCDGLPYGYITAAGDAAPEDAVLRAYLVEHLPRVLIPVSFTALSGFPRTLSGKVDRKALERGAFESVAQDGAAERAGPARAATEDELQRLDTWNLEAQRPRVEGETADRLFDIACLMYPDRVALRQEGRSLSYRELGRLANRIALRLRREGIGAEDPVLICGRRSIEALVAMLAVVKAGATYVPVDAGVPERRMREACGDCGARAVFCPEAIRNVFDACALWLDLDDPEGEGRGEGSHPPEVKPDDRRRAYIIYTSGSTGRPKGVEIEHRSLVNLIRFYVERLELTEKDRSTMLASIAFDASVADGWPYLCCGASVYIPPDEKLLDPPALFRWIGEEGITVSFVPTALAERLLESDLSPKTSLRYLLTGGDRLRVRPAAGLSFGVINTYGPTENTVDSTWDVVRPGGEEEGPPPIGRPIANVGVYVLDPDGVRVAPGEEGELVLGGRNVARGYLGRGDLTRERFPVDPFSGDGARMYRTGDRVRFRDDGRLDFLGRKDDQVQIRGHRVEPGEVEHLLRETSGVRDAAVRPMEEDGAVTALAAWVVPERPGAAETLTAAREAARAELPAYMVPAAWAMLDELPRNASGKVDREALPAPNVFESAGAGEVPATERERELAAVWEEVLDVGRIGRDDNFFDLGGHSLMVLNLVSRVKDVLGVPLSVAAVLQRPTLRRMAEALEDTPGGVGPGSSARVPVREEGKDEPVFCVPGAGGGVNRFRGMVEHLKPGRPFYGLEPLGLSRALNEGPIEDVAEAFLDLVREVQPHGPYFLGGFSYGGHVAYTMAQRLRREGEEVALLFLIEAYGPDVRCGPAVRALRYAGNVLRLKPADKVRYVKDKIRWFRMLIRNWWHVSRRSRDEADELSSILRAHMEAAACYDPEPYDGRMVLLRAERPPNSAPLRRDAGWKRMVRGGMDVHFVPGDHYTIFDEGHHEAMAETIGRYL
ncbi:non-ribosomal peptide synthetase [Kiritimatiella glycovorans]|uniref:Linear gramicidin synthase subunit D n=1 Tax=Kiritimatiella glycovorans TaxID=1307763 RepID=A0A0G3ECA9_9BACT|nr:non-ribosomal peptide synthetase [Kiritimatiella glycovorans]AKJ64146.1 Linear gramicidin synthase subunit D [Kiritimatiella glycovorans]